MGESGTKKFKHRLQKFTIKANDDGEIVENSAAVFDIIVLPK